MLPLGSVPTLAVCRRHAPRKSRQKTLQVNEIDGSSTLLSFAWDVPWHTVLAQLRSSFSPEVCGCDYETGVDGRALFCFRYLGACRRRTPRDRLDLKAPKDASHRRLFR